MRDLAFKLCALPFFDAVVVKFVAVGLGLLFKAVFQVIDGIEGVGKSVEDWLVVLLELFGDSTEAGFRHNLL